MKTHNIILGVAAVTLLTAPGCSGRHPTIRPVTASSVVVAFGDSLTAGTGATKEEAYPAVLAKKLGCDVINEGIPGQTTSQGLDRLPELIKNLKPTLVLVCYGGNDMLQDVSDDIIKRNLRQMVDLLKQGGGSDVVLIGVPRPKQILKTADFYDAIAADESVPCEDHIIAQVLAKDNLKSDDVHPNAQGYSMMADAVATLVVSASK